MRFETQTALALEAAFEGGRITSDGGLVWLAQADSELGLCERVAEHVPEWRKRKGRPFSGSPRQAAHLSDSLRIGGPERLGLFARRPFAQALVRVDAPERGGSGEPAHDLEARERALRSRLLPDGRSLFDLYLTEREKGGAPKKVLLDFDSTADPTHGDQEGSFYHGYYKQHIYHPLLVFDGQTGHLICVLLRAGNTHGGNSAVALLKRVVARQNRDLQSGSCLLGTPQEERFYELSSN